MPRVAIVSYDVQSIQGKAGGFGAFTTRWASLLRQAGETVTVVMTRIHGEPTRVGQEWRARYQEQGISLVELQAPPPLPTRWPDVPTMRVAEIAAPVVKDFDIVYFQDWGNAGFHLMRERRYSQYPGPICVTVLHGPSEWQLSSNGKYPELPKDLHLAYQERYSARHSDFVISPSRYMACHLDGLGWKFPAEVEVLGFPIPIPENASQLAPTTERVAGPLPPPELARYACDEANARWLEFHRKAVAFGKKRRSRAAPTRKLTVDVCITYYQKSAYLGQLLDALEQQTESDFHVIAVDDGSPDAESQRVFQEQSTRAAKRGWDFYRQENAFVDAARNSAARRGSGDLILFIDSDDVPARNSVARMREAITLSGDNALICASYLFASDKRPFNPTTGEVRVSPCATCIPLGMDLVGGWLNPSVFGGSMFIIRRSAFEELGGFRELRGAGHEDWELYVRLALKGFQIDILPELLHYYRQVEGSLARTLSPNLSRRRLLDAYEDVLGTAGLQGGALALASLYQSRQVMEYMVRQFSRKPVHPSSRYAFFSRRRNRFETDPGPVERLRNVYRKTVPLETRLKLHEIFLAPFFGAYNPSTHENPEPTGRIHEAWRNEATTKREYSPQRIIARRAANLHPTRPQLRLLLLTCYFPFGTMSGWHKRVQEMIRYFGTRYELTLVAPTVAGLAPETKRDALRYLRLVRGVEEGDQIPVPGNVPFRVRERYMDSVRSALRALPTEQYDAAFVNQVFMAEFRHDIETIPVLTEHNIESRLLRQAAAHPRNAAVPVFFQDPKLEAERLEQYENRTWPDFPLRAVTSEVDRAQIDCRCSQGKTVVASNGADASRWLRAARHHADTVLFAAHLKYFPNVDAVEFLVEEIWPHVRRRKPEAKLIIAGREPEDSVAAIVSAASGVELIANPKSMERIAKRASLTVAPLRLGSGTRHKILESMAWGLPVVSTTLGVEGIEASDGDHLLVRDDPKDFAEAIVRLMSDELLWHRLRRAGNNFVRERYSWDRVFKPLEEALIELVS